MAFCSNRCPTRIQTDWSTRSGNLWGFAYPNFTDCRDAVHSLEMAAWRYSGGIVEQPGEPGYIDGLEVTANLFSIFGVAPYRGRAFLPEDDRPGAPPVAIVSYE